MGKQRQPPAAPQTSNLVLRACFATISCSLFVIAGVLLLAIDLRQRAQLWQDTTDIGFWGWARHNAIVLVSAELELAACDAGGRKLWSMLVKPP